jgi:glycosyltransferase involved in cell wall biosynthesis
MNILHINQSDLQGGAAVAMGRLHDGLLRLGVSSSIMASIRTTGSDLVHPLPPWGRKDVWLGAITRRLGLLDVNIVSTFDIVRTEAYQKADLLHFHALQTGYFNYLAIPALTKTKPAVLTLHDMWMMTGHCSNAFSCERWKTGCGKCPHPEAFPPIQRDATATEWKLKRRAVSRSGLRGVVAISRWMENQAKESILGKIPISCIHHGIDTELFQPLDRATCRSALNIPRDANVILFGAQYLSEYRKGGDLLLKALKALPDDLRRRTILLTFGEGGKSLGEQLDLRVFELGFVSGDRLKVLAYSAADVFVSPARAESFGLVLQEAAACGVPSVGFRVGGIPDIVRHGETGLLADPEDWEGLARGIVELLENPAQRQKFGNAARNLVETDFDLVGQARRHQALYRKIKDEG